MDQWLPAPPLLRTAKMSLQSLQRRHERYITIYMQKLRHSLCPNDLQISFSESDLRLGPLPVISRLHTSSRAKLQTLYENFFAVVGPKLQNLLPANVKSEDTITSFKAAVYTFCSTFPDIPPVPGYDTHHLTETPCQTWLRADHLLLGGLPRALRPTGSLRKHNGSK